MDVLDYALCSAPGAPVKVALLEAGIGEDNYSVADGGLLQPYFSFVSKNARENEAEKFISVIEDTLRDLVKNGIDRDALLAAINLYAFRYKEADFGSYPKGLMYGLQALDSWLYDDMAPFMYIEANDTFKKLRTMAEEGYFEKLIEELILENPHKVILTLAPSKTLAAKTEEELKQRLKAVEDTMSESDLEKIAEHAAELKAYQASEDSPEDLAKIPMLQRSDLKREAEPFRNKTEDLPGKSGRTGHLISHDYFTNGVSYLRFLFDVTGLSDDELFTLSLLKIVIGLVDTANFTYGKLDNEINLKTGGISSGMVISANVNDREKVSVMFEIKAKCFEENTKDAVYLINEILTTSDFTDTKRLREILAETRAGMQASLSQAGHQTAIGRALSHLTKSAWISEQLSGIVFLDRLSALLNDFDAKKDALAKDLTDLLSRIVTGCALILDYTGKESGKTLFEKEAAAFLEELKAKNPEAETISGSRLGSGFEQKVAKEGFCSSADVCYVCRAGDFAKENLSYTGAMKVLKVMMGYDYLWLNVRVQGGAYGCMSGFLRSGLAYFVSYRDPNLEKTIAVYEGAPDYIKDAALTEDVLTKYIIGAIASQDMPLTPRAAGQRSLSALLTGWTLEHEQKEREEMIDAEPEDLHALAGHLTAFLATEDLCVVGKEQQLKQSKGLFEELRPLLQ